MQTSDSRFAEEFIQEALDRAYNSTKSSEKPIPAFGVFEEDEAVSTRDSESMHEDDAARYIEDAPTVLFVDDDADIIALHRAHMKQLKINVLSAMNGHKALEVFKRKRPDVVVTDFKMPHMNGIQLLKALKAEMPGISVIFSSGVSERSDVISMLNHGSNACQAKFPTLPTFERAEQVTKLEKDRGRKRKDRFTYPKNIERSTRDIGRTASYSQNLASPG